MDTVKSMGSTGKGPASNGNGNGNSNTSSFNSAGGTKRGLVAQNSIQAENLRKQEGNPGFEDASTDSSTKEAKADNKSHSKGDSGNKSGKADRSEGSEE